MLPRSCFGYVDELLGLYSGYPLAGKKIEVTEEMLPNYQL